MILPYFLTFHFRAIISCTMTFTPAYYLDLFLDLPFLYKDFSTGLWPWSTSRHHISTVIIWYTHGLVQERCNPIANALELHLSCTNPSIYNDLPTGLWPWPTSWPCVWPAIPCSSSSSSSSRISAGRWYHRWHPSRWAAPRSWLEKDMKINSLTPGRFEWNLT